MDNVENVENVEDDMVIDLEEEEEQARQQAEEDRLRILALISRPGDGNWDLAGWLPAPSTSAPAPAASASASLSASSSAGGSAGFSASAAGVSPMLLAQMQGMQLLMEQAALLKAAEEKRVEPGSSHKFQLLNRAEKVANKPLPVTYNTGLLLRAQLGQLFLGLTLGGSSVGSMCFTPISIRCICINSTCCASSRLRLLKLR